MEDFYKRQGVNTGNYQEHLNDYSFFKKFKAEISKNYLEINLKNKQVEKQNKDLESKLEIAEQLMEQGQQEIEILREQLKVKQITNEIAVKHQQLANLKQKLLGNNSLTTESELNNLCRLQKELIYLEQQNQIMENKIFQAEFPKP